MPEWHTDLEKIMEALAEEPDRRSSLQTMRLRPPVWTDLQEDLTKVKEMVTEIGEMTTDLKNKIENYAGMSLERSEVERVLDPRDWWAESIPGSQRTIRRYIQLREVALYLGMGDSSLDTIAKRKRLARIRSV